MLIIIFASILSCNSMHFLQKASTNDHLFPSLMNCQFDSQSKSSMLTTLYQWLFRFIRVRDLYQSVVEQDRLTNIRPQIRADLAELLATVNQSNPFFRDKFTQFLADNEAASDDEFFAAYSQLPSLSKQDYAQAGRDVMNEKLATIDPKEAELRVEGKPLSSINRLRRGDYMMQMATGGSTSLPLAVQMTKHHMFSMLFTFFKCWYRMGWRPGQRMLVFYPKEHLQH